MGITLTPIRYPKCGCWVKFAYFDTTGQYWTCPKCGTSRDNQTYVYNTTTKPKEN